MIEARPLTVSRRGAGLLAAERADSLRAPSGYRIVKRAMDVAASAAALVLLMPVLVLVAVAISVESPGPILFRQRRFGYLDHPFTMLKFRTMRATSAGADPAVGGTFRPGEKPALDPRVTRVGRFLRRWSFDEVPNLVNVLRGEMSLVGPRPTSWPTQDYYWHDERMRVPPGVTGLWQVSGRADLTVDEMATLDCDYIRTRSLLLDLTILVRTAAVVCSGKGAY